MCGFITIYSHSEGQITKSLLENMTHALAHRGPDDYGFCHIEKNSKALWKENGPEILALPGVAMGHRRLSIVDLSEDGRQPFVSSDKRFWMVYNGEVFNYLELREELKAQGHVFSTQTDTEVVIAAYKQWGVECLNRLNGMWAILLWDDREKTLFAARDRFGIKPLFFTTIGNQWFFSSEIKGLLQHPAIDIRPDKRAIFRFLWTERSPEGEETYFKGIHSLPAATFLMIKNGQVQRGRYWNLPDYDQHSTINKHDVSEEFKKLFTDSVRLRLRADVRVGTMMSGGLDSTSIVKTINDLLADNIKETESIRGIQQTISACFPNEEIDETDRVQELINMLRLNVEKVFPASENVEQVFHNVVTAMEMPFKTSTPLVQYLLMHRARKMGLTVVLNGHGSDEMLGGYPYRHSALIPTEHFLKFRFKKWHEQIKLTKKLHNTGYKEFVYTLLFELLPGMGTWARDLFRTSKKEYFRKEMFNLYPVRSSRSFDKRTGGKTVLDRRLRREFFGEVLPVWLAMEDRVSMSASVESRLPFMDYRLVEFAFGLEDYNRIRDGITKYVLRNAMKDQLPESIVNEKYKYYFSGPEIHWLRTSLKPVLEKNFLHHRPMVAEFLKMEKISNLIKGVVEDDKGDLWDRRLMWRLFMTEGWMRRYFSNA